MSAALDFDHPPVSMLDLLLSILTADPGADTAREWADDMPTAGVSSDAPVEPALLGDREWHKAAALLHRALRDVSIESDPPGPLLILSHRLLLRAWLDGRLEPGEFYLLLETRMAREPGTGEIGGDRKDALSKPLHASALHRALREDGEECPVPVEEDDVAAAARTAFARFSA